MKKPTLKQKVDQYEAFLHLLNVGVTAQNNEMVRKLVTNADNWSYAHRVGNGELSERKQDQIITRSFWRLCEIDTPPKNPTVAEHDEVG